MMPSNSRIPESILIVRLGAMGDVLHAMTAVAALRRATPGTRIGWSIERRWMELLRAPDGGEASVAGRKLVDTIHEVDTHTWRKHLLRDSTITKMRRAVGAIRAEKYDIAIDVQGAIKSALIARLSGAPAVYGFAKPREQMATLVYSRKVGVRAAHVIDQNLELFSTVAGQSLSAADFELPVSQQAERWCETTLMEVGSRKFAILNPGSGWGAKCWPAERFGEVARRLMEKRIASVVNYGPGEQELAKSVSAASGGAAHPVSCSLTELIALTRRAALFVGGDTGPLHLAAALKVPVVALFGPTEPARNGPYGAASIVLRSERSVTSYSHVAEADPGLQSITVDEVLRAVAQLTGASIG
ncbi:MAG: lipopolysaccharide heptosyltransferase I [Acidobacteriaceae bacterium]